MCKGDVALLRAVSDEPVSIVVCTSGLDEPVPGVTPYETGSEECVVYESAVALRRTGSNTHVLHMHMQLCHHNNSS